MLTAVELRVATTGSGRLRLRRSDADGSASDVQVLEVVGDDDAAVPGTTVLTAPLTGFDDGGWLWFELDGGLELVEAGWHAPSGVERVRRMRPSIGITTLDREAYLLPVLATLAADRDVLELLDKVIVVDQGSRRVADEEGFAEVRDALGEHLLLVVQPNLGGSGGFARNMLESLDAGSDGVVILDDDVAVSPEGIRRAIRFAEFATVPTIVGGHMFDMHVRSRLHAFSEGIRAKKFFWETNGPARHDFAAHPLLGPESTWLHRRAEADYNGWWMCLIPAEVLRAIGLAMPFFIKWDDAEYGVRAAAAGYPTVSLPGAAIWHVSFDEKDDTVAWQGYFHARNRLASALIHSRFPGGGSVVWANFSLSVRYLLAHEYGAQKLRNQAYRDVLAGPAGLHASLATKIGEANATLRATPSGAAIPEAEWDRLTTRIARSERIAAQGEHPGGAQIILRALPIVLRGLIVKSDRPADAPPQAWMPVRDARWWNVGRYDSVATGNPNGSGGRWMRRDRAEFRRLLREAWTLSRELKKLWPTLSEQYRAAAPGLVSVDTWRETLQRPKA